MILHARKCILLSRAIMVMRQELQRLSIVPPRMIGKHRAGCEAAMREISITVPYDVEDKEIENDSRADYVFSNAEVQHNGMIGMIIIVLPGLRIPYDGSDIA